MIEKEYCLIDSAVALHWIQNLGGGYKQYVQDRADECKHNTPNALFRHIPGTENSADLPSRGCTPDVLEQMKDEWFHSRKWVKEDESTWPTRTVEELVLSEEQKQDISKEIKKKEKKVTILAQDERSIEKIIDPTRFGTFNKLLRVTALVRKFIDIKCKRKENIQSEVSAEDKEPLGKTSSEGNSKRAEVREDGGVIGSTGGCGWIPEVQRPFGKKQVAF